MDRIDDQQHPEDDDRGGAGVDDLGRHAGGPGSCRQPQARREADHAPGSTAVASRPGSARIRSFARVASRTPRAIATATSLARAARTPTARAAGDASVASAHRQEDRGEQPHDQDELELGRVGQDGQPAARRPRGACPRGSSSARGGCPGCRSARGRSRRRRRSANAAAPSSSAGVSQALPAADPARAITPRSVEPAARAAPASASRSAGSTSAAIATSRLLPMPPNALPASRAPSARTNRASARSPTTTSRSPQPSRGGRSPTIGTRRVATTTAARTSGGASAVSGPAASLSTRLLAPPLGEVPVRLQERWSAPVLEARLHALGDPEQQRGRQQDERDLDHPEDERLDRRAASISGPARA